MYFSEILEPMLKLAKLDYHWFVTNSSTFVNDWVNMLDVNTMPYTEFVIIGGDGLFNQLINAFHNHLDSDTLMKMPIGIIPGGSTNAIACDLGGKNPYEACSNIIRGHTSS